MWRPWRGCQPPLSRARCAVTRASRPPPASASWRRRSSCSYSASPQASGLASGRTLTIGVVVPFVTRWFFVNVVAGAYEVLHEAGYDVLLYHLGTGQARDRFFERMPLSRRVDAVLTLTVPLTEEHTLALRALDMPLVTVGRRAARGAVRPDRRRRRDAHRGAPPAAPGPRGHRHDHRGRGRPADFGFASSRCRRAGYLHAMLAAGLAAPGSTSCRRRLRHRGRRGGDVRADGPARRCPPRSSPSTTSWPSGRFARCAGRASPCRAACRWWASTATRWRRSSTSRRSPSPSRSRAPSPRACCSTPCGPGDGPDRGGPAHPARRARQHRHALVPAVLVGPGLTAPHSASRQGRVRTVRWWPSPRRRCRRCSAAPPARSGVPTLISSGRNLSAFLLTPPPMMIRSGLTAAARRAHVVLRPGRPSSPSSGPARPGRGPRRAARRPAPCSSRWPSSVLGTSRPSRNSALPIPVPKVSSRTTPRTLRPAPNAISATPAASASLSTVTGRPSSAVNSAAASSPEPVRVQVRRTCR